MMCSFPRPVRNGDKILYVPCGQCICCRINKTTEWSARLLLELSQWKYASFVTLTYDDCFLPANYSLRKTDLQKFFKRLRYYLHKDLRSIRYYACGEYGEKVKYDSGFGRPHYHAIILGLNSESNDDRKLVSHCWRFCRPFLFDKEHDGIGTVNSDSIQYTTGYVRKKLMGLSAQDYEKAGIIPPFQLCSKGLGLRGYEDYVKDYGTEYILFNGHKISVPKYFKDKLEIENPPLVDKMKLDERKYLLAHGYSNESVNNLDKLTAIHDYDKGVKHDYLEDEYYSFISPRLEQNHQNKIKYLSIQKRGEI